MRLPKTVKGYISMFEEIEAWSPRHLKGIDGLSEELQDMILLFDAVISNEFGEIREKYNQEKEKKMPKLNLYIPKNPGKDHLLKQLETLRKVFFKEFGVKLTDSKIILLCVEGLLREKVDFKEKK